MKPISLCSVCGGTIQRIGQSGWRHRKAAADGHKPIFGDPPETMEEDAPETMEQVSRGSILLDASFRAMNALETAFDSCNTPNEICAMASVLSKFSSLCELFRRKEV